MLKWALMHNLSEWKTEVEVKVERRFDLFPLNLSLNPPIAPEIFPLSRRTAARILQRSCDSQLLKDRKDFPGIAVRVGKPELILPREATG
jgi:hypothetical protein